MAYPKNSFQYQDEIGSRGSSEIITFLEKKNIQGIVNIEKDSRYQKLGVDLIITKKVSNHLETRYIEIKTDQHYDTGNYFLEVIGNDVKGTPGGIIYTMSNFIYYYFIDVKELHIIDTEHLKNWIFNNQQTLRYVDVPTVDNNNNFLYNTVGALVSRNILKEILPIWIYELNSGKVIYNPDAKILASFLVIPFKLKIFFTQKKVFGYFVELI